MDFTLDTKALDELLPFALIVDSSRRLEWIGRSLQKLCPAAVVGADITGLFRLEQPFQGPSLTDLDTLAGEFIKLIPAEGAQLPLRGQVCVLARCRQHFLFSLVPDVGQTRNLDLFGLDFSDFALADPIVDQMLLWQLFRQARDSLEAANARLAWRDVGTDFLHQLPSQLFGLDNELDTYRVAIEGVCKTLKWDVGQVFHASGEDPFRLKASTLFYLSDSDRFSRFRAVTQSTEFAFGEWLPGKAAASRTVTWLQDVMRDPLFLRRESLAGIPRLTGAAIPVVVEDKVVAVIELFTERVFNNPEAVIKLLDLVRRQVEHQVGRQEFAKREREQQALLFNSAKMATLGALAAGVAHDIKSPLSAIAAVTEVLKRKAAAGEFEPAAIIPQAVRIQDCVAHIASVVSDLQNFSRDATGDPPSDCKVADLIRGTFRLCSAKFMQKRVEMKIEDVPPEWMVRCRAPQVSQVLLNLINNAYDAVIESERPWVRVSVADEGSTIAIAVSDSGAGIPPDVREKMMEPFFTTKPPGKGTGLGLSISRRLMQANGGELVYEASAPHTTFIARLPKAVAAAGTRAA